ncbi:MAG: sigma 54-interacting transcriptional regulator [Acidobacteriota bacterium]
MNPRELDRTDLVAPGTDAAASAPFGWGLVALSARMREVIVAVERAGASRLGVCLTGEPGTGRELVARAIHRCGLTAREPFVPIPCDEIPPSEAERLVFGATAPRFRRLPRGPYCENVAPGALLHQAVNGTLYLRHPEELPDRAQARLARALRDGEVQVGSDAVPHPLAVRPVAAFGLEPQRLLAEGRVRADFYRRVSAIAIDVPPLRDRREDIPLLAAHVIARTCRAAGLPTKRLTEGAATLLASLPWPGNARDLHLVLAAVVKSAPGQDIDLDVLLCHIRVQGPTLQPMPAAAFSATLREAKTAFEREYITAVLAHHHGRVPEAARALGVQRTNLYRKLRSLRVHPPLSSRSGA